MKKEKKKAPDNHQRDAEGDRKKPDEKALVSTRLVPCRHVNSWSVIMVSFALFLSLFLRREQCLFGHDPAAVSPKPN
ncbi:hypothetical protein DAPPUDRAFT_247188 [Daphnia pulex]|uniref:Uncharacterized protein n=1 Tax=Daphnia pulex TaxID=6669 RepID=E9GRX4_DAPPU|nr:hypothetical protein DAPPUDRAFT_247188 [Daphnia pulex]|eukprot:EFX77605.1 hypothetical protein DAPPUDRAFT_247188 [Daphnia pulex]